MKLSELTRTTAFRVAVTFAAFFFLTGAAIFFVLYNLISSDIETKLKSHIAELRDTLVAVNNNSGFAALTKMVAEKGPPSADIEVIYLLTDPAGNYLAGNILPVPRFDGWTVLPWDKLPFRSPSKSSEPTDGALSIWTPVNGGFLLVGDGNGDIDEAQDLLLEGLAWGMGMALFSALLGGTWLGIGAQRRIDKLESALVAVSRGELATRVPRSSTADDLDHVAGRINATLDHLQRVVATVGQVSVDIAHDLKTPITRIQQRVETSLNSTPSVEAYRATMADIQSDLHGIVATFEALLRIAQIEAGARKARFTEVDLKDILCKVTDAYEYVGEDTNHRISADVPEAFPARVHGDRDLLTQLFANLIENAIRHTPPGSKISVGLTSTDDSAVASVSDNGLGIPDDEREKVFRRLYRLDKSRSTPGSGLGLSLVAAIAKLHDAEIKLTGNTPGLAATLTFPIRRRGD